MLRNTTPVRRRIWTAAALVLFVPLGAEAQTAVPGFSKQFSPSTIGPGSTSTLVFTITNDGASAVANLAFSDTLPAAVTIATPAGATSSCGGTLSAPDGGPSA